MKSPIAWTTTQLKKDAEKSKSVFRKERIEEPVDQYVSFYEAGEPAALALTENLVKIFAGTADMHQLLSMNHGLDLFRYLTAPPISADDLSTLSGVPISRAIINNKDRIDSATTTIGLLLDPKRFPWIGEQRKATSKEIDAAVVATASCFAAQKVQTDRRGKARKGQEGEVKDALVAAGYKEASGHKSITLLSEAPSIGQFSGECMLGSTRADLVARLPDGRVLAIECKTSNSAVNSFKRINHEALGKAVKWLDDFGKKQVVPAATLQGVFSIDNLENAQERGLFLFWNFRISDLISFAK